VFRGAVVPWGCGGLCQKCVSYNGVAGAGAPLHMSYVYILFIITK
jgi:hypothetical protein